MQAEALQDLFQLTGKWQANGTIYQSDPIERGYLVGIESLSLAGAELELRSSALTHTEWWHHFIPVNTCPRYRGQLLEIADDFDVYCQKAACDEACGAEDRFVDLSAGRLRLAHDRAYIAQGFHRLQAYLTLVTESVDEINQQQGLRIELQAQNNRLRLQAKSPIDPQTLKRYQQAFQSIYPQLTQIYGKANTSSLPPAPNYSEVDITPESVIEEARYYALIEATYLEALDMLQFLVLKKGGSQEDNIYYLPEQITYHRFQQRLEAYRSGLYMGRVGFKKGSQEIQQFFQTTLGGGRW